MKEKNEVVQKKKNKFKEETPSDGIDGFEVKLKNHCKGISFLEGEILKPRVLSEILYLQESSPSECSDF